MQIKSLLKQMYFPCYNSILYEQKPKNKDLENILSFSEIRGEPLKVLEKFIVHCRRQISYYSISVLFICN